MEKTNLAIGDLAKATGTKVVTIRYYEQAGLLPAPAARTATTVPTKLTICIGSASFADAGI